MQSLPLLINWIPFSHSSRLAWIPSGSNDPYALRRATAGILRIIENQNWDIELDTLIAELYTLDLNGFSYDRKADVMTFINGRVAKMLEGTARYDIIEAVLATGSLDVAGLRATEISSH